MKFDFKNNKVIIIVILAVVVGYLLYANNSSLDRGVIEMEGIEIKEYEGKDLSSVNDFRENSIKGVQYVDIDSYKLKVLGLVEEENEYTYDEVIDRQTYSKVVTLNCVEGWSATILWEGIILRDLLLEAKPLPSANTIIFHAYDGYTTAYPIDYIMGHDVLMAYKMNNATIIPARGFPFQLVAEDKWGYKWIKWITEIEFSDDSDYEGFWESRGYSTVGNLNGSYRK
jgi:DMSO/TMAO reductase YedYZ molybdopterin-dependent catalytic subunit